MKWIMRVLPALIYVLLISSCASTTLVDTWQNPAHSRQKVHNLLVVSIARNSTMNRTYEDVIVAEINRRGINAMAGYKYNVTRADRRMVDTLAKNAGADAVLTLQTTGISQRTYVEPGYGYYGPYYGGGYYGAPYYYGAPHAYYGGSYAYYGGSYGSSYTYTENIATMLANLYDAKGNLLWAGTIRTDEPGQVVAVSKDVAKIVSDELIKAGYF